MAQDERPGSIQSQSETEGSPRPGNGDIRVLLVGINDYKDERVKDLGGCISDINRVESFLKNRFGIEPSTPASTSRLCSPSTGAYSSGRAGWAENLNW